ncbi:hypothetical protein HMPREF1583_01173 [Gardnerella vaginalis JCP8151B]|nr:hypothetical protein HMPREF1583_01173 [Gardnerella vaginalis JCP8151B]
MLSTLSKLGAPNCLFVLRSKRKGMSERKRINLYIGIIKSKLAIICAQGGKNGN